MDTRERKKHQELLAFGDVTLNPGIYFVEGAKNGALCDTNSGAVYSVNEVSCQVLSGEKQSEEFWMALQRADLASEMAFQLEQKRREFDEYKVISRKEDNRSLSRWPRHFSFF